MFAATLFAMACFILRNVLRPSVFAAALYVTACFVPRNVLRVPMFLAIFSALFFVNSLKHYLEKTACGFF